MSIRSLKRIPRKDQKAVKAEVSRIGALIQNRRKELGYTQEEFAEHLDLSINTVKYIEQGRRVPSLPVLLWIAKSLKIEVAFKTRN